MSIATEGSGGDAAAKSFTLGQAAWLRALERTGRLQQEPPAIFPTLLDGLADRYGHAPALMSQYETLSFHELAQRANRWARWGLEQDLAPGAAVALLMPNCPDYLAIWLGLTRIGCVAALLNTNLAGASLAHCIDVSGARHVIVADSLSPQLDTALPLTKTAPRVFVHGGSGTGHTCIDPEIQRLSGKPLLESEQRGVTLSDRALCIYTSGTTGLPKAANVSHNRIVAWSHWFAGMMDVQPQDRLYNCLPLYHAVGGVAATGALLTGGGSVFIKEKFSVRDFWRDVAAHECTIFQYIGELCRYLLRAPESQHEQGHRLRLCCGNGLGGDIWPAFKERFQIPHILEFYAATEANFSLYNTDEEPGSIGRIPPFLAHRFPVKLIHMDAETLEPARNEEGLCVQAAAGEPGEAVFPIAQGAKSGAASFEGYTAGRDSDKKILHDVMRKGDAWYRSGDLLRKDRRGFYYFADRLGDTFRWKGENVSALEVMQAVSACPGVIEAIVYGVALPNSEGRAGMAAISVREPFDLSALKAHLDRSLPRYSQPLFIRIIDGLELTATFRPKKTDLALEGCDPNKVRDRLYFNDFTKGAFVKLDASLYEDIILNRVRL